MLFNSYSFLFLFLPLTLLGFFLAARVSRDLAAFWLAGASLAFYACWSATYVLLLLLSVLFNYALGYVIGKAPSGRKWLLAFAVLADLALLGYYKYAGFFLETVNAALSANLPLLHVVLPLGISFFTFTQIAFLVDVYRGHVREYRFVHYLLFVTYFPHLIAGPVLHHKQMMPQFALPATYQPDTRNFALGCSFFILGLAKKVLLADNLGDFATPFFGEAAQGLQPGMGMAWMGALAYTLQLYFDFSGYSDMAIGLSLLLGVRLPINFDSPYQAVNIIDFWRRWHMTLSAFLRDYLYIPLGGNRQGKWRRYGNLLATMVLGGLWHGANWTFVAWGALHGLYLCINHGWRAVPSLASLTTSTRGGRLVAWASSFIAVVVAWVFFRSDSFSSALLILQGMSGSFGWSGQTTPVREQIGYWVLVCLLLAWLAPNTQRLLPPDGSAATGRLARLMTHPVILGLLLALSLSRLGEKSEFLYFQF